MNRIFYTFIVIKILYLAGYSQPILIRQTTNPIIENAYKNFSNIKSAGDTLSLPFFDDFSKITIYPDQSKWQDNYVFVNSSFGINPPSLGVATFDILNMSGELYAYASETPFISDYLTSNPINLSYFVTLNNFSIPTNLLYYYDSATGTYYSSDSLYYYSGSHLYNCFYQPGTFTADMNIYYSYQLIDVSDSLYYYDSSSSQYIHIERYFYTYYNLSDSLYLSFYYQGQGMGGHAPANTDSLVLEFKTPETDWIHIWSAPGKSDSTFQRVMIPISDSIFLKKGFQFRFYNYGSLGNVFYPSFCSNTDFWNLDYVYLDYKRNMNDTIFPDVTFRNPFRTFVKEPFTSIPWEHYKLIDTLQIDTLQFTYYNLDDTILNIFRYMTIKNLTNEQFTIDDSLGSDNIEAFDKFEFKRKSQDNYFPDNNLEESLFEVKISVTAPSLLSNNIFTMNDTLIHYQKFSNYYSVDDGTPEYGIGLAGTGSQNGQFAMYFKTYVPDTLRGVYMFFNRSYNNSNQKYFYMTIWTVDSTTNKPSTIIYKKTDFRPEFDGLNDFHYYDLDTAIYVNKDIFIGWIQTSTDLLNLGFDLNNDYSDYVYYNLTGSWNKLPYKGTPMIRPVFSKQPIEGINYNNIEVDFQPYPNPASEIIYISNKTDIDYSLFDLTGKIIKYGKSNYINVAEIENGIYLLKTIIKNKPIIKKIIINH